MTEFQEYLLIQIAEECCETGQRATKAWRFTPEEIQPIEGETQNNAQRLVYEFNDILTLMEMLKEEGVIDMVRDEEAITKKRLKVKEFFEYSKEIKAKTTALKDYFRDKEVTERDNNSIIVSIITSDLAKGVIVDILHLIDSVKEDNLSYVHTKLTIVTEPKGKYQNEADEYPNLIGYWVNQTTDGGMTGDEFSGNIYVTLDNNKFLKIPYEM